MFTRSYWRTKQLVEEKLGEGSIKDLTLESCEDFTKPIRHKVSEQEKSIPGCNYFLRGMGCNQECVTARGKSQIMKRFLAQEHAVEGGVAWYSNTQ